MQIQFAHGQGCGIKNGAFNLGERIDYTIYYHLAGIWVGAGEVFFEVNERSFENKEVYHFNSFGKTFSKYDWIYEVRDHYEAYCDKNSLAPVWFNRKVNEGSTHIREEYKFNLKDNEVYTYRQMDEDENFERDTVITKGCSYDVLTMIYYARNIDFTGAKEDQKFPVRIFIDNEAHDTYIRFKGIKELNVKNFGTFRCIVFSPYLIEGSIFNAGEDMTVWVTDDQNKLPLLIETRILVGSIRARIESITNLKHPLTSRLSD